MKSTWSSNLLPFTDKKQQGATDPSHTRLSSASCFSTPVRLLFINPRESPIPLCLLLRPSAFPFGFGHDALLESGTCYPFSCIRKACETLALDLRGYGTHLIAPETVNACCCSEPQSLREPRQERCATAAATSAPRTQSKAVSGAWSVSRTDGGKDGSCGGGDSGDSSRPPPFGPVRGSTLQDARTTVVIDQVGGNMAVAHCHRRNCCN